MPRDKQIRPWRFGAFQFALLSISFNDEAVRVQKQAIFLEVAPNDLFFVHDRRHSKSKTLERKSTCNHGTVQSTLSRTAWARSVPPRTQLKHGTENQHGTEHPHSSLITITFELNKFWFGGRVSLSQFQQHGNIQAEPIAQFSTQCFTTRLLRPLPLY